MPANDFELITGRLTEKAPRRNVIVFAENRAKLTDAAAMVDAQLGGMIARTLRNTRYQGGAGEFARVNTPQHDAIFQVLVAGTGRQAGMEPRDWWRLGLQLGRQVDAMGLRDATIALGDLDGNELAAAQALVEGFAMALYRFETYKTVKEHQQPRFERLTVLTTARAARLLEEAFPRTRALLQATHLARDVVNTPPNVANPQLMADEALKLEKLGVRVEVIDEVQMEKLGLNLFLAVGGAARTEDQPRLVLMHYDGRPKAAQKNAGQTGGAPIAIVGKGIMYDTGGYSLKPSGSMAGMKFDMAGSAAVLGAMRALAERQVPVNVIGVMACAMNMVGSNPYVPDSIYKSYKGTFVEIGNTDAEGRLVLADAIAYTIDKYQPAQLVDLATLTGAIVVALGGGYAGLFSTNNALANALQRAGDAVGERLWRMPVDDFYTHRSKVADLNNASQGPAGGASVAAAFIRHFADKTPWAHLDIAAVANSEKAPGSVQELPGATGFGVRLLVNWLESTVAADALNVPLRPVTAAAADEAEPETTPARRRRGRPALAASAVGRAKSRRGRPAGSKNRPKTESDEGATPAAPRKRGRPKKNA